MGKMTYALLIMLAMGSFLFAVHGMVNNLGDLLSEANSTIAFQIAMHR